MVDLRKPDDRAEKSVIREYTPVHICDEVYPSIQPVNETCLVESQTSSSELSIANFLRDKIIKVSKICSNDLEELFGEDNTELDNVIVENNVVVYAVRETPLSRKHKTITSPVLNSLQRLLLSLESTNFSFDNLCDFLDADWSVTKDNWFFKALCNFFVDIRNNDTAAIEGVLNGSRSHCYKNLFCGSYSDWERFLYLEISSRLFRGLHSLLARETKLKVHPLFLFACQNFYAVSVDDCHSSEDYYKLMNSRSTLTAYGISLNGVLFSAKSQMPSLFSWVDKHANLLNNISWMTAVVGVLFKMIKILPDLLEAVKPEGVFNTERLLVPDFFSACMMVGITSLALVFTIREVYWSREETRRSSFLYNGLKCFFDSHKGLTYEPSKQIMNKLQSLS